MARADTETHCHCTARYNGSDHCPECGCEQYESGDCGHTTTADNAVFTTSYEPGYTSTRACRRWGHHRNPTTGRCNRCAQEV